MKKLTKDKIEIRRLKEALAEHGDKIIKMAKLEKKLERANRFIEMCREQIKNLKSRIK